MNEPVPEKQESITTSALYGVAIIQALMVIVGWMMFGPGGLSWIVWVLLMGSVGIYIGLGVVARKRPFKAAWIGGSLFAIYLTYQTLLGVPLLAVLIYRIPVAGLLLTALITGWKQEKRRPPNEPQA